MSSRLPMGVETMYNPFSNLFIAIILTFIISCSPQNNLIVIESEKEKFKKKEEAVSVENKINQTNSLVKYSDTQVSNEIEILLPKFENEKVTNNFINAFELSLYKKNIKNISLAINLYSSKNDLNNIINKKSAPGKIFLGPLTSFDIKDINNECSKGVIFFSFASDRQYAEDCIYLVNFFPEDDLITIFNNFKEGSKIALLYPENSYGYYINSIIDPIATKSNSIIINRASYKEDLSNARDAIKELSKYELRKYELDRQKKILKSKNDEISKKALKKIQKFETIGAVEFSHIIIPDYSIRLLQIAPLLPFYDIDPNKVQFVGTGVWDNEVFFNEPSLQGAIFPGIPSNLRKKYMDEYYLNYKNEPIRTITIAYDLIGIISYILNNKLKLSEVYKILNDKKTTFDGIDGKFKFQNNVISRDLNILKISNGSAKLNN